ncbi:MAG: undecaprenyl-phosphate glucose phosphotransferase [Candidatus Margulisiibacteriota bacterium]
MKMQQRIINTLFIGFKLLSDIVIINISFILSFVVKFKIINVDDTSIEPYLDALFFVTILWLVSFYFVGLYRERKGILPELDEVLAVIAGVTIGTVMVTAFSFFYKNFPGSRWVVLYTWFISTFLLSFSRLFIFFIHRHLKKKGVGNKRALVIGADVLGQSIATKMIVDPILGYHFVGFLADSQPKEITYYLRKKLNILGKISDFKSVIKTQMINTVFLALPKLDNAKVLEIATYCSEHNITFQTVPNLFELMASSVDISELDGIPLIALKESMFSPFNRGVKRLFDIISSLTGLVILSPIFLITALAIKLTSPGPVFYRQERVGLNGSTFSFYKFRSMKIDAEKITGPVLAQDKNDPRATSIGKFLRHTSLDELPQLFNVLKGDMSLVGPRPERPYFVDKYNKEIPNFVARHTIRGGITGWAQVNGRAELTVKPEEKLRYDLYYIENWSLLLDVKILIKTFSQVLLQKNVY